MSSDSYNQAERTLNVKALEENFIAELHGKKRRKLVSLILLNLLGIVLFLLAWEILPRIVPNVNILMFPPPSSVVMPCCPC